MSDPANAPVRYRALDRMLAALVAVVMIGGGIGHLAVPQNFVPLVPPFLPAGPVILASGLVEIGIGLAVLWPGTRGLAGLAFALLCAGYLPLHLWDFFRPDPVFAPPAVALARVVVQGLFIWAGLTLWRRNRV
jgi:uncharacterized membrane protein